MSGAGARGENTTCCHPNSAKGIYRHFTEMSIASMNKMNGCPQAGGASFRTDAKYYEAHRVFLASMGPRALEGEAFEITGPRRE
jgi:hypothetical protein